MQLWLAIKAEIAGFLMLERDALHIYAGLLALVAAGLILRRPLSHPLPWAAVLALELANEAASGLADGMLENWEISGSAHDLWNTMLAPTALLLLTRLMPFLFQAPAKPEVHQAFQYVDHPHRARPIEDAEYVDLEEEEASRPVP